MQVLDERDSSDVIRGQGQKLTSSEWHQCVDASIYVIGCDGTRGSQDELWATHKRFLSWQYIKGAERQTWRETGLRGPFFDRGNEGLHSSPPITSNLASLPEFPSFPSSSFFLPPTRGL